MAGDARRPKGFGAISLALGGIASGFLAAACCALPMLLASAGLGSAWLVSIAVPAAPYRLWFVAFGAISLVAGGVLLARQQMRAARCGADGLCVPASLRFGQALIGLLLRRRPLWLGYPPLCLIPRRSCNRR